MQSQQIEDVDFEISEPQAAVMATRQAVILNMAGQGGGKSQIIGYLSGGIVIDAPQVKQFIGANTYMQLSQSTLTRVFDVWEKAYDLKEYDPKANPGGAYVVDKKPPMHFDKKYSFKEYNNIISFWNGAVIFTGSLDNWKAHEGKEFGIAHLDETKDTEETAIKEMILGRLRQYGYWFDQEGNTFFCDKITKELSQRHGWEKDKRLLPGHANALNWTAWNPLYIHTSPALGGTDWLNSMFKLDKFGDEILEKVLKEDKDFFYREFENKCVVIYSTHHNEPNLPPNYISNQKATQTEEGFLRVVHAYPFGKTGGAYFPGFFRRKFVKPTPFLPELHVNQTWDFNVVPYMTCVLIQFESVVRYLDEVGLKHEVPGVGFKALDVTVIRIYKEYCKETPHNSTESVCEFINADHDPAITEMSYYGDASGLSRIPGLGSLTNYKIIVEHCANFFHNFSKKVKGVNIGIFKRRDLLNRIFEDKIPALEIQIDPSCVNTIKDFEKVKLGKNGKVKVSVKDDNTGEKVQQYGHTSDAVEYCVCEEFKEFIE